MFNSQNSEVKLWNHHYSGLAATSTVLGARGLAGGEARRRTTSPRRSTSAARGDSRGSSGRFWNTAPTSTHRWIFTFYHLLMKWLLLSVTQENNMSFWNYFCGFFRIFLIYLQMSQKIFSQIESTQVLVLRVNVVNVGPANSKNVSVPQNCQKSV